MEKDLNSIYYDEGKEFNYIRYNSLPSFADYVIDHPKQYYDGWGVQITYNKPIGIDLQNIKPYDKVFVTTEFLESTVPILKDIHVPYHLITGVGDNTPSDSVIENILQTRIVSWVGNNIPKVDDRFLQVPIGLTEIGSQRHNSFTDYVDLHLNKIIPLVITPVSGTHNSRKELQNLIGYDILNMSKKISFNDYMYILSLSKFSYCPRGNGVDTHRVTESILFNSIPIVKTSILDPMYTEMNAVIVTDLNVCKDIDNISAPQLNRDVVTLEYWNNRIMEHHKNYEK